MGRRKINYEEIYEALQWGPLTLKEIQALTGVPRKNMWQVIATLSVTYPVWNPQKDVFKLAEESDYR